ncbi:MAG: hypothetical protein FD155_3224 [Bacteroidetes bacterium]|nr:MAG: hypothetical protein FD155_3224 [Bacteroidota bacterium]
MRIKGILKNIPDNNSSVGKLIAENGMVYNFDTSELMYSNPRQNDNVSFDSIISKINGHSAFNITFLGNQFLSDLDKAFQLQIPIECEIINSNDDIVLLTYHGIIIELYDHPEPYSLKDQYKIFVFIKRFSHQKSIIASAFKTDNSNKLDFKSCAHLISNKTSVCVTVVALSDCMVEVLYNDNIGQIDTSHLHPLKIEDIELNQSLYVTLIGISKSNDLNFSVRNLYYKDVLKELEDAYMNQSVLQGKVSHIDSRYIEIDFKGITVFCNLHHVINWDLELQTEFPFKVMVFSSTKEIIVTQLKLDDKESLPVKVDQLFKAETISRLNKGYIVSFNDCYTAFLPINMISKTIPLEYLADCNKNFKINVKIKEINKFQIKASRIGYQNIRSASKKKTLIPSGSKLKMKIKDKPTNNAIPLTGELLDGYLYYTDFLPGTFIKYLQRNDIRKELAKIFKRRTEINCILIKNELSNFKEFYFILDRTCSENQQRIEEIIELFSFDENLKLRIKEYNTGREI